MQRGHARGVSGGGHDALEESVGRGGWLRRERGGGSYNAQRVRGGLLRCRGHPFFERKLLQGGRVANGKRRGWGLVEVRGGHECLGPGGSRAVSGGAVSRKGECLGAGAGACGPTLRDNAGANWGTRGRTMGRCTSKGRGGGGQQGGVVQRAHHGVAPRRSLWLRGGGARH